MRFFLIKHIVALLVLLALLDPRGMHAQITLDGTMGASAPLIGPNYKIPHTLGQIYGPNLFHSFKDFNLANGESATFTGPNSIANLLARVTGGNPSAINGRLASTIPGVNFFFINPNGVVFGPNAQVNIGGDFVVSTADFVRLQNGGVFHAGNPAASVLTSAPPSAFGFLNPQPAPIEINGSTLRVNAEKSLSLIGGNVQVYGADLRALRGTINVVSVGSAGEAKIDVSNSASVESFAKLGDVTLREARLAVSNNGSIRVRGANLILNNSIIRAVNSGATLGGGVDLAVTGRLTILGMSAVESDTFGSGTGGNVSIAADTVILNGEDSDEGGTIAAQTFAVSNAGQGGNVTIRCKTLRVINGEISTDTLGDGTGGNVTIVSDLIHLLAAGEISADTDSTGLSGSIVLNADTVILDGQGSSLLTGLTADAETEGRGGGSITVTANRLDVLNGAQISAITASGGNGGVITIKSDAIRLFSDSRIFTDTTGSGAGGNIIIAGRSTVGATTLTINDNNGEGDTGITSDSSGSGSSGNIFVTGKALHVINGGVISSDTDGAGNGGNVMLNSKSLHVLNGGEISADTDNTGQGGSVLITAEDIIINGQGNKEPTGISAGTQLEVGAGNGGNVTLNANTIHVLNGANITVASEGSGNAGTLTLKIGDKLRLSNGSSIQAEAPFSQANGGNIEIVVGNDIHLSNSNIISLADGSGGNIRLSAGQRLIILGKSRLKADAVHGNGGNINITANVYLPSAESTVSASSQFGVAGNFAVQSPNTNVGSSLVRLTTNPLTAESYLQERCAVQQRGQSSSFTVRRQRASPPEPSGLLPSIGVK